MKQYSNNRKIKNATITVMYGKEFKSKLEARVYQYLKERGYNPFYEYKPFSLVKGLKPNKCIFYSSANKKKVFKQETTALRDITYTPDFTLFEFDYPVYVEVKGITNDVYPVKRKMFRILLESFDTKCYFFEVRTLKDVNKMLEILKTEKDNEIVN